MKNKRETEEYFQISHNKPRIKRISRTKRDQKLSRGHVVPREAGV
jgi:hypothetical protein